MSLTLKVISYRAAPTPSPLCVSVNRRPCLIGRGADCGWVLADPEKCVSKHHALVEYKDDRYFITDTSVNGVFINDSAEPVGHGHGVRLNDGDRITIGDYQIVVVIENHQPVAAADFDNPFADWSNEQTTGNFAIDVDKKALWDTDSTESPSAPPWPASPSAEQTARGAEADSVSPLNESFPSTPQPQKTSATPQQPSQDTGLLPDDWLDDSPDPDQNPAQDESGASPVLVAPVTAGGTEIPENTPGVVSHADPDKLIKRFLEGAGIMENERLKQRLDADSFYMIGKILKTAIQGAMEVLMARAQIKTEMRLDVTTIRSQENNPLKFSCDAEEALLRLFESHREGYMPPVEAVEEAFADIKVHQLAVLAGMQTALQTILRRFDPKKLEQRLQRQSPISASIPIHKQAKLWSLFELLYEEIGDEMEDDFNHLFGKAFAKAYTKLINQLKTENLQTGAPF